MRDKGESRDAQVSQLHSLLHANIEKILFSRKNNWKERERNTAGNKIPCEKGGFINYQKKKIMT